MKKLFSFLLAIICTLSASVGLTACGNNRDSSSDNSSDNSSDSSSSISSGYTPMTSEEEEAWNETATQGLSYKLSDEYECLYGETNYIITGLGTSTETEIRIPASIDGIPVKWIQWELVPFDVINSTKEEWDAYFEHCQKLNAVTSVTIPDSVVFVDGFGGDSLREVTFGKNVRLINGFSDTPNLTSVVIPEGVTELFTSRGAFSHCENLTNVSVPDSLVYPHHSFNNCPNLQYNVQKGLKYLGNAKNPYALLCGVTDTSITTATVNGNCKAISYDVFKDCTQLTDVIFSEGITSITEYAFSGLTSLQRVTLPSTLTRIYDNAFSGCSALESISIPNGIEFIGVDAFKNCNSLTYTEKNGLQYLGNAQNPFVYLTGTTNTTISTATIENGCKLIKDGAFDGCTALTYTVKDGLSYLGSTQNPYMYLADADDTLTQVSIDSRCKVIGTNAFSGYSALTELVIPDGVVAIHENALTTPNARIVIPDSVLYLSNSATNLFRYANTFCIEAKELPTTWSSYRLALQGYSGLSGALLSSSERYIWGYTEE